MGKYLLRSVWRFVYGMTIKDAPNGLRYRRLRRKGLETENS